MVNSTTSTREVIGAFAAVVKRRPCPPGNRRWHGPRAPQLGKSRAEQEAADAPDSQAGGQGAPHGSHAEDDGDGEYFQEQQDGGSRGVKFIMNEGGDDIFAVPYDFRVKDGDGSHQHACRRQAHGQPLALAVQVPARFLRMRSQKLATREARAPSSTHQSTCWLPARETSCWSW